MWSFFCFAWKSCIFRCEKWHFSCNTMHWSGKRNDFLTVWWEGVMQISISVMLKRVWWEYKYIRVWQEYMVIVNKLHRKKVVGRWSVGGRPTTYRPPTDHLPTTYRPPTDHLPTTYRPPTDHLQTTYRPPTNHFFTVQLVHDYQNILSIVVLAFNKWRIHCTIFKISFSTLGHVFLKFLVNCKPQ